MKIGKLLVSLLIALLPINSFAALNTSMVWEVRTTGSDTNGGGFKAGASGTDWSQQNSPQYSTTDAVTAGTTTVTSATANFGTDIVGNVCYIQGGTGSVAAGWYEVTARASTTSITVDRSTGLTSGTGATIRCGGALATINQLAPNMVGGNTAFIKGGTNYTTTSTITFSTGANNPHSRISGYTTTRGDNGKATLQMSSGSSYYGITISGTGIILSNITVDANNLTSSGCITVSSGSNYIVGNKCLNYTNIGINNTAGTTLVLNNEVTAGSSTPTAGINLTSTSLTYGNYVHDGVGPGIVSTSSAQIMNNVIANMSGATSDGIRNRQGQNYNNTVYNCGRHGIYMGDDGNWYNVVAVGNILVNNGGYGLTGPNSTTPASPLWDGNAFYNNTSGAKSNVADITNAKQNSVGAYTPAYDITLSGSPFTNAGSGDFSLNNTAGAGAAVRDAGRPNTWPGGSFTGYPDLGAVFHQDPGTVTINPNFAN